MSDDQKSILWRSISVFVLTLCFGMYLLYAETARDIEEKRQRALQVAGAEASVLSQYLNASVSLTYTLEALLREKDFTIDQNVLDNFSAHLLKTHPAISNLQYAPNGIVTYISPMAGNEAAIGHNLLQDPKRNKEAFEAVKEHTLTVAGPFELLQGGIALVARLPIFTGDNQGQDFWGFSTVLIKIDDLMRSTSIGNLTAQSYSWNIYRIHPDTKQPHIFYGTSAELIPDSVQIRIKAPNATWYLNLKPANGWLEGQYAFLILGFIICLALSSCFTYFIQFFLKQPQELKKQVQLRTDELGRAKDVLAKSEERLTQITENKQMWVWEVDAAGRYTYSSKACKALFGYEADEIVGQKHFYDLFHPDDRDQLKTISFNAFANRQTFNEFENRNLTKSGETVWLSTSGVPMVDDQGILLGYRGADIDITERKKLLEEHARSAQLAALGTVAAGVAHEINNPINGILNYATLLGKKSGDPAFVAEIAARITRESERIAKITRELLHYAKNNREERVPVNLNETIASALDLIVPKIRQTEVAIEPLFQQDLPEITVNPQSIQQIIINLVDNAYDALRYKKDTAEDKVIKVKSYTTEHNGTACCCIEVHDNGIGMPETVIAKAKDAFFSTKPSTEGSGLGLSIVNEIVNKHNGIFDIESTEGRYTRINIYLPLE